MQTRHSDDFYEYTDKVIQYMLKRFIRAFSRANNLTDFDEANVIGFAKKLYAELRKYLVQSLKEIANEKYSSLTDDDELPDLFFTGFMTEYNEILGYVIEHEIDRKRAYFVENLVATKNKKAIEKALKLFSNMAKELAVEITDRAAIEAYENEDVKKVRWNTERDSRVCEECRKRDLLVYPITKIPRKPHVGCRCYLTPVSNR